MPKSFVCAERAFASRIILRLANMPFFPHKFIVDREEEVASAIRYFQENVIICLGLVNMYLKRQKSLTVSDENREVN